MRIGVVVLAIAIILALSGSSGTSVRDAADRLTDQDTGSGSALKGVPAEWAREVAAWVEETTNGTEGVAAQKVRAAVGALREAALEEFERAQDRLADTVKQVAAETLQQASDRLQELASGLKSP